MLTPVAVSGSAVAPVAPAPVENAQVAAPAPQVPQRSAAVAKLICRRPAMTGSQMPGKQVCATAAQWREAGY